MSAITLTVENYKNGMTTRAQFIAILGAWPYKKPTYLTNRPTSAEAAYEAVESFDFNEPDTFGEVRHLRDIGTIDPDDFTEIAKAAEAHNR